jgi:hypothetical protein
MAIETKVTLKSHFERGDQPTSAQFSNLIDSMIKLPVSGDTAKNGFIEVVNTAESTAHVPATLGRKWFLNVETTAQGRDLLAITSASALGGGTAGLGILAAEVTASVVSQLGIIPVASLASAAVTSASATPFDTFFESSELSAAVDTEVTALHGLGIVPRGTEISMVNRVSADGNYPVGRHISFTGSYHSDGPDNGLTISYDASAVVVGMGQTMVVISPTTNNDVGLNLTNWRWVIKAWV